MGYLFDRHKLFKPKHDASRRFAATLERLRARGHYTFSEALSERCTRGRLMKKHKAKK